MPSLVPTLRATLAAALVFGLAAASAAAATPTVRLVTLGTGGGPLVRLKRSESANALVVGSAVYLIDCGDRCMLQLAAAHIPLENVRGIFITHYHQDHVGGLMPLLGTRWMTGIYSPLQLVGPPGLEQIINGYREAMQPSVDAGVGTTVDPLTKIDVREVGVGAVYQDENIKVWAAENAHYHATAADPANKPKSYAYRIETQAGSILFTGDTAPAASVTALAKGADVIVSEVINVPATIDMLDRRTHGRLPPDVRADVIKHFADDHMLPEQVGQLARDAGAKRVILSHLSPGDDSDQNPDALYAAGVRSVFKGPVTVAEDLESFNLDGGR